MATIVSPMPTPSVSATLADSARLFRYHQEGVYGAQFNLKGFAYPWLVSSRSWSKGEGVLDVGGGYLELPAFLAKSFGLRKVRG